MITTKAKGAPQILIAEKPYKAFNSVQTVRASLTGQYSYVGLICLAEDQSNYVCGYIKHGSAGIMKVRGSRRTILSEVEYPSIVGDGSTYDIRFSHRDGLFSLECKSDADEWPVFGSMVTYSWTYDDGKMLTVDDIMHVGVYSWINPPHFITSGFVSNNGVIPVKPLDSDDMVVENFPLFPESGTVEVNGVTYSYSSKNTFFSGSQRRGPYQLRSIVDVKSKYARDPDDNTSFQTGKAVDMTFFDWRTGASGKDDFTGAIVGSGAGYAWVNDQSMFRPWVTTDGVTRRLMSRSRHFSDTIPSNYYPGMDKIWLTDGLTGISTESVPEGINATGLVHPCGAVVFLSSNDEINIHSYFGCSGDDDESVSSLIDRFAKISGASVSFPGDKVFTGTLTANVEEEL